MKAIISIFKDGKFHGVRLTIGVQSFTVSEPTDEGVRHARWMASMLQMALQNAGAEVVQRKKITKRFGS